MTDQSKRARQSRANVKARKAKARAFAAKQHRSFIDRDRRRRLSRASPISAFSPSELVGLMTRLDTLRHRP